MQYQTALLIISRYNN